MLIGTILVICFVIGVTLFGISSKSKRSPQLERSPQLGSSDDLEAEIIWNLKYKSKIVAIKVYRQRTGVGLKEAKAAVEIIAQANESMPTNGKAVEVGGQQVDVSGKQIDSEKIQDLVLNKRKIEAISYYRRTTGVGLKEAKEAVERLEEDLLHRGYL